MRAAVYHRLHWLWPVLARPWVGRLLRVLGWGVFALWLLFVVLVLVLRYAILPQVGNYQADIERMAGEAIGQPVHIGRIAARWQGLNPDLVLDDVRIDDREGLPVFSMTRVESVLSWQTLWHLRPTLALLSVDGPVLNVRRETDGRISIAGMETRNEGDPAFVQWVLEQKKIRVQGATIVWEDRQREAPQLVLEDLQLALDNSGRRHRFGVSATPPENLASRIELRGEFKGNPGDAPDSLAGRLFVELDYADLAGWHAWLDYPVRLAQGRGALRLWGEMDAGEGRLVSDFALEDVRLQLGRNLPELDLASMRGRCEGRFGSDQWSVSGSRVELLTRDGLRVAPSDFLVNWKQAPDTDQSSGDASASFVDLGVLARLAAYVPLDARSRELLLKHRPQGRVTELRASWALEGETLKRYALKAGFSGLGLDADGYFPGARGLGGHVDLNEKEGDLVLDTAASGIFLPAVFPEPEIVFDKLKAKVAWNVSEQLDIRIDRLEFAGPDAAGTARGNYRHNGSGPGDIDLLASLERADGRAVWRYMPHVVNADARAWLRRGIVAGQARDVKLVLQGDLADFPFRDGKRGRFEVTARALGAKIDYAPGWPVIDNVDADLSFGFGMKIRGARGAIFGTTLSGVEVDIPDFDVRDSMLLVRGVAQGPTMEFLRFIDQSPVAGHIDHFTDGMKASGNGRLDLELDMPLRHVVDTRLRATYHFLNNQLQPIAELPPLTQVNGQLKITESSLAAPDLSGQVFGGPFRVQLNTAGDKLGVHASGTANIAEVGRFFGYPLLDHLSGKSGWKAEIGIRKRRVDLTVDADLVGVTSPLPEPLGKSAAQALPLHLERSEPDATREQYKISVGKLVQGLFVRRQGAWERAVLAVGEAETRLPDKGFVVRVALPQIDADAWKKHLAGGGPAPAGASQGAMGLNAVFVKTPKLHFLGRDFSQFDAALRPREGGWQIGLNMREAVGDIFWRSAGEGAVEGSFKRLVIKSSADGAENESSAEMLDSLPAMNLVVEDFQLGERTLGKLELKARNDKGAWHLDHLALNNPDGGLNGKGIWSHAGGQHQTRLDFELEARNLGKLLDRMGYPDTVRRGTAKLAGDLQWSGPLTGIHYPSLSGHLSVSAEKGQFNKLEPGVGKLLGLISLQSLPRRLTLDFRDVFSDGLAFDSITSTLVVQKGIMRTVEPLRIKGPAAHVEMQGETDLKNETQDMQVVVRPEIGNVAAVGVAIINPVAGAATLLANTVVSNPLNRLFSYRYHVTGTWADPRVEKAGESAAAAPEIKLPGENRP